MSDDHSIESYGEGFGIGAFCSIFAMVGLGFIFTAWKSCCQSSTWEGAEIFSTMCMTGCGSPFAAVPLIIGLIMHTWIVPATGYGIPIIVAIIKAMNFNCKNPVYRDASQQQHDNDNDVIVDDKPSYNALSPKRNAIIWNWLGLLDLVEYHDVLVREGYATLSDLQSITAEDLNRLGITKQMHIKKILRKISDEKNVNAGPGTNIVYGETGGYSQINLNVDVDIAQPAPGYDDDADVPPAYDSGDVTVF